jgi:small subunit ribosomal protein S24e
MKILKQEEHQLLDRIHVEFEIDHPGTKTPTKEEVAKKLSELLKVSPELIKIKIIKTKYGGNSSRAVANVYKDIESFKVIEEFRKKPKKKEKKEKTAPKK